MLKTRTIPLLCLLLAACGMGNPPEVADLPTLVELPTLSATPMPPDTATPTATLTATLPLTPTITLSPTLSVTPSATITETATPTATHTPLPTLTPTLTPDNEGLIALALLAAQATILPQPTLPAAILPTSFAAVPTPPAACVFPPPGGFGTVYLADPTLASQIGCPVGAAPVSASAYQTFERGFMVWVQGPPTAIYTLYNNGRYQRFDDTYNAATDPASGGETPPTGLAEPVRGFGKVWRQFPDVRANLGWANSGESGGQVTLQAFDRGQMLYLSQRGDILILVSDPGGLTGSWRAVPGSF